MKDDCEKEVDLMEKEAKYKIIQMEEDRDASELDDTKKEISSMFAEFRSWLKENINSEEIGERMDKLKHDTAVVLEKGKKKSLAFAQREDVIKAKRKVVAASEKVADSVQDGIHSVMENEHVSNAVTSISDTIDQFKRDAHVKENVNKLKKGTLKVAEHAYNGLKKVLDTDSDDSQKG